MSYDFKNIEQKWQKFWEERGVFVADTDESKEKFYALDMFPYPSGAGLHVGHPLGYTATDIHAKFALMHGKRVLHPMGWDAFGLPAENYAIKTKIHPKESTEKNIITFTRQIKSLGLGYDWTREINTSSEEYYKWTQWFFGLLFQHKLAYKKYAPVNWCESCMTVLANEQVVDGRCERCGNQTIQKNLSQWFFKITQFADDLINDLDSLDWMDSLKQIQRNWIGRSVGAQITFQVKDSKESFEVYTTRPDTLFGVTYVVLAPDHPLVESLKKDITNWALVEDYRALTKTKSELERTANAQTKTGVNLGGVFALHPITKKEIPIFISDYVLSSYGTGAIMAVPAHDQRDHDFARKFSLPIVEVIAGGEVEREAYDGDGVLVNSGFLDGMDTVTAQRSMIAHLETAGIGYAKTQYKLRDWLVSRQRYWGAPIPIVYDDQEEAHLVPTSQLPVVLPVDVDFMPTGESPLKKSKSFNDAQELQIIENLLKASGALAPERKIVRREADTMDTFVCSSWYFLRYLDPKNLETFASKEAIKKWAPVDLYVGGLEHAVLHLLFARFFTKVLHKYGYIDFNEPFLKLRNQGLILGETGEKMSKSKGNVVNPDDVVTQVGADALRVYLMFIGPFEEPKPWNTNGLMGCKRFLDKLNTNLTTKITDTVPESIEILYHQTIKKVTKDIETMSFNTAVSQMMILNNAVAEHGITKDMALGFAQVLAPFAPHLGEELFETLGGEGSVFNSSWPTYSEEKIALALVEIPIQINSKLRSKITVTQEATQKEIEEMALGDSVVQSYLQDKEVKKIIYIPGKLINIMIA